MNEKILPAGSIDCHVHIYGPFDRWPAQPAGRFTPRQAYPLESLLELWDSIGVPRGVIVHANGLDNESTLDALRRYPERLRGIAVTGAEISDKRLDELNAAGFRGVRINLLRQDGQIVMNKGPGLEDLVALAPRLAERGWHAQLWIESGDLMAMADIIEKLPIDLVIDHQSRTMTDKGVDYPGFRWFCDRLRDGRYWCKLSGADRNTRVGEPYADTDPFMKALVAANPDRLVWGSDWPHVGHEPASVPKEQTLVELLRRNVRDPSTLNKILIDNPTALYGF